MAKLGGGSSARSRRPVIVTGVDFGQGLVARCPWCREESPFDQKWRGEVIPCPHCQGPLRVNKFVVGESMLEVK